MAQDPTSPPWQVMSVTNRVEVSSGNTSLERMVVVSYKTARGYVGEVRVPQAEATEENVRKAIQADYERVASLYSLQG